MQISGFEFPDGLYYDKLHSWARVEGNVITQGLTTFGQAIAQEIVFVEAPRAGRDVEQGQTFMSMESGKWVGRIAALSSGKITEVNEELEWEPSLVNESSYDEGWLVKIEMSDSAELDNLMKADSPELKAFIEEEAEKYKDILG
ncbi:MAG: glycine cleavage system protein GcvH [Chloroflexota bacterium]|nr:glycine cleavage system protein GcvH [Chloroflexota bacterium]